MDFKEALKNRLEELMSDCYGAGLSVGKDSPEDKVMLEHYEKLVARFDNVVSQFFLDMFYVDYLGRIYDTANTDSEIWRTRRATIEEKETIDTVLAVAEAKGSADGCREAVLDALGMN